MSGKRKNETNKQRRERLQRDRFLEAYAVCGDFKRARRVVGMGLEMAHRALMDPDGVTKLQKHLAAINPGDMFVLNHEQRKAFLTSCIMGGIMPRVIFDMETGEPTSDIIYEPISQSQRFKCLDMLNKMEGAYVEKTENVSKVDTQLTFRWADEETKDPEDYGIDMDDDIWK